MPYSQNQSMGTHLITRLIILAMLHGGIGIAALGVGACGGGGTPVPEEETPPAAGENATQGTPTTPPVAITELDATEKKPGADAAVAGEAATAGGTATPSAAKPNPLAIATNADGSVTPKEVTVTPVPKPKGPAQGTGGTSSGSGNVGGAAPKIVPTAIISGIADGQIVGPGALAINATQSLKATQYAWALAAKGSADSVLKSGPAIDFDVLGGKSYTLTLTVKSSDDSTASQQILFSVAGKPVIAADFDMESLVFHPINSEITLELEEFTEDDIANATITLTKPDLAGSPQDALVTEVKNTGSEGWDKITIADTHLATPGEYTLTLVFKNLGGTSEPFSHTFTVGNYASAQMNVESGAQFFSDSTIEISGDASTPPTNGEIASYAWKVANSEDEIVATGGETDFSWTPGNDDAGTFTVSLTVVGSVDGVDQEPVSSAPLTIVVIDPEITLTVNGGSETDFKINDSLSVVATVTNEGSGYKQEITTITPNGGASSPGSSSVGINLSTAGTYTITHKLIYTTPEKKTFEESVTITAHDTPTAEIKLTDSHPSKNYAYFPGTEFHVSADNAKTATELFWKVIDVEDKSVIMESEGTEPGTISVAEPGAYRLELHATNPAFEDPNVTAIPFYIRNPVATELSPGTFTNFYDLEALSGNRLLVGSDDGLAYRGLNERWERFVDIEDEVYDVCTPLNGTTHDAAHIYAMGKNNFYQYSDEKGWETNAYPNGLASTATNPKMACSNEWLFAFFGGGGGGSPGLYSSNDDGGTWKSVTDLPSGTVKHVLMASEFAAFVIEGTPKNFVTMATLGTSGNITVDYTVPLNSTGFVTAATLSADQVVIVGDSDGKIFQIPTVNQNDEEQEAIATLPKPTPPSQLHAVAIGTYPTGGSLLLVTNKSYIYSFTPGSNPTATVDVGILASAFQGVGITPDTLTPYAKSDQDTHLHKVFGSAWQKIPTQQIDLTANPAFPKSRAKAVAGGRYFVLPKIPTETKGVILQMPHSGGVRAISLFGDQEEIPAGDDRLFDALYPYGSQQGLFFVAAGNTNDGYSRKMLSYAVTADGPSTTLVHASLTGGGYNNCNTLLDADGVDENNFYILCSTALLHTINAGKHATSVKEKPDDQVLFTSLYLASGGAVFLGDNAGNIHHSADPLATPTPTWTATATGLGTRITQLKVNSSDTSLLAMTAGPEGAGKYATTSITAPTQWTVVGPFTYEDEEKQEVAIDTLMDIADLGNGTLLFLSSQGPGTYDIAANTVELLPFEDDYPEGEGGGEHQAPPYIPRTITAIKNSATIIYDPTTDGGETDIFYMNYGPIN
jgi:hypothetical protein